MKCRLKKPGEAECVQFTRATVPEFAKFVGEELVTIMIERKPGGECYAVLSTVTIDTTRTHRIEEDDWVLKDADGVLHALSNSSFRQLYNIIKED